MPSIAQSQKSFLANDGFSGLNDTAKNPESISLDNVEAVLFDFAEKFIATAKDNLEKSASVASGKLSNSIKQTIKYAGSTYTLRVTLADYYDFINKGVSGTKRKFNSPYSFKTNYPSKAMVEAISQWLKQGKLKSTHRDVKKFAYGKLEAKNKSLAPRSMAYAVSTSIKMKGIKPTYFMDNAFEKTYPQLKKDLAKAMKEDFKVVVRQINSKK